MTTFDDLDQQLSDAAARLHRAEHVQRLREAAVQQAEQVRQTIGDLEMELEVEERDVTRLEGGFFATLARIRGNHEERLDRERAEAAAARQRVEGHRARLAQLEADVREADAELTRLSRTSQEYTLLLEEKERRLLRSEDPRGRALAELATELGHVTATLREHTEAHQAGHAAHEAVGRVLHFLNGARGASTWDMFGGGLIADSVEHNRLLNADQAAWQAQRALDVFARELADVGVTARPELPKVDTRWFVDTLFDNIITDVLKHQRIENTRASVDAVASWVRDTGAALKTRHAELSAQRKELLARREEILRG